MRDRLLAAEKVKAIDWQDGALHLLDQRILPFEETWIAYTSAAGVAEAIRSMVVRGAPAIGISAAYERGFQRLDKNQNFKAFNEGYKAGRTYRF